jgi:hypothetical protein
MYQPADHETTSPARVAALDSLGRKIVKYLNESPTVGDARERIAKLIESEENGRQFKRDSVEGRIRFRDRGSSKARFLNKVKQRIGSSERVHDIVFGSDSTSLKGKITVDEWGTLM